MAVSPVVHAKEWMLKQVQHGGSLHLMELPDHYPLANAPDKEVLSWAYATEPPYGRIREAAPWLRTDEQVRWYLEGLREALANPDLVETVGGLSGPALDETRARM
jgi:hypothetical protein